MADKPARSLKLPDGFEDEAAFIKDAREKFQRDVDFDRENRDQGLEDLKFLAGEQWDAADRAARTGRPCLMINTLPQYVAQVSGDIRLNKPSIRVRPAEDADKDLAEIREGLIRAIERDNDATGVYVNTGESQVACGIGNFRISLKYATDDGFDRDIAISAIPNPFAVVWDSLSTERTGRDATRCFVEDRIPRADFDAEYKDKLPSDMTIPVTDPANWFNSDTVRVTEYWFIKETPTKLALLANGDVVPEAEASAAMHIVKRRTVNRRSACMYLITGKCILDGPFELPIDRVPIIRARGWEINVGEKRVRFGLVRFAKDPQKLKNFWRSIAAETLIAAPKGKWLASTTAVNEDREDDFRAAAKSSDPLLLYDGATPPTYTNPPPMPTALLDEAALSAQDMKDVTGLHDASLGAKSNETSGRAILARQKEGDVATYVYHDNLQAAICEGGRIINQLIPITFDTARTIRVLGEDESVKVQRINDPNNPDSVDINQGKYDIAIETGPSYSTKRAEAADSIMQFVQAVPQAAAAAADLIAQAQDWPMADTIAARLKKTIPPQLLDGEEGAPQMPQAPPPSPLDEAAVRQANAEADLAETQAAWAELQLAQASGQAVDVVAHHVASILSRMGLTPPQQGETGPMSGPPPGGAPGSPDAHAGPPAQSGPPTIPPMAPMPKAMPPQAA